MSMTNVLLGLILLFLVCTLWFLANLLRRGIPTTVTYVIDPGVRQAIEEIAKATAHHVDVAAIAEMVRQLDDDPSMIEQLKNYPLAVQRALLAHYADQLGQALREAQDDLRKAHTGSYDRHIGGRKGAVARRQAEVDEIRGNLDRLVDKLAAEA
jgi:DNA-binding transcriptional MerR regulator